MQKKKKKKIKSLPNPFAKCGRRGTPACGCPSSITWKVPLVSVSLYVGFSGHVYHIFLSRENSEIPFIFFFFFFEKIYS